MILAGTSIIQRRPVSTIIVERLPRTVELVGLATLFSLLLAIPIGVISAVKQYSLIDHVVTLLSFIGIALPTFWLGIMFILLFSVDLHWLPTGGTQTIGQPFNIFDRLKHLAMPVTVLTVVNTAGWSRYMRSSMLEVLRQDYVRTAHAKGLANRAVLLRHACRNAMMPIITLLGLSLPTLVGARSSPNRFSGMGRQAHVGFGQQARHAGRTRYGDVIDSVDCRRQSARIFALFMDPRLGL